MRTAYRIFSRKIRREDFIGRRRLLQKCKVKTDLKETGCRGVDWIYLVRDRDQWRAVVNTAINLRFTKGGGEFLDQMSDCQFLEKGSATLN